MLPNTVVAYNANDLLKHISDYNIAGVEEVVVKRDRKNGGLGVHYFPSVEEVYNFATFANLEYPIVLQPFAKEFKDIRVIALGEEYSEAYERSNSANFRHNLHCGGQATPYEISEKMVKFCQQVMNRGKFPYAHIDLMQMDSGAIHLIEINLRGGLRGAQIDSNQYKEVINKIHHKLVDRAQAELS